MKKKLTNITLILMINIVIIAAVLYSIEGYLYLSDPRKDLPFNGYKDGKMYTWGHLVRNNKLGFRERDFSSTKRKGEFRIMVLGDSLTWGAGLSEAERYTNLLETRLRKNISMNIEVLNFGLSGGTTVEEKEVLKKHMNFVKPDLIVVAFCENDPEPISGEVIRRRNEHRNKYSFISVVQNSFNKIGLSYVSKLVYQQSYNIIESIGLLPDWLQTQDMSYDTLSNDWILFLQALSDIKNISDKLGLPQPIFIVLNRGIYKDRPTNYRIPDYATKKFIDWYHQAEEAAFDIGFYTLNVEKELANTYTDKVMAVNILDEHPNSDLQKIYADKLYNGISPLINDADSTR